MQIISNTAVLYSIPSAFYPDLDEATLDYIANMGPEDYLAANDGEVAESSATETKPDGPGHIDWREFDRFINLLDPKTDKFTYQVFDDDKRRKDDSLAEWRHGTLEAHMTWLEQKAEAGCGVFVMVNHGNGKGRNNAFVRSGRMTMTALLAIIHYSRISRWNRRRGNSNGTG